MEKKVGILNMVSKIKFQNFKYGIKLNMARKYVLKEIESKHYLKENLKDIKEDLTKELTMFLIQNSPRQE